MTTTVPNVRLKWDCLSKTKNFSMPFLNFMQRVFLHQTKDTNETIQPSTK